ncbi:MAG: hypothetical protein WBF71_17185 [Microthrixaceae bacterium]
MPVQLRSVMTRVVVGATVGAGLMAALPATASATDIPVYHWNMKGGCPDVGGNPVDDGNCGGLEAANHLINRVINASSRPWHITLNEVCTPQFTQMKAYLQTVGYSGVFTVTNPSTNCGEHGNAVFTLGVPAVAKSWNLPSQTGEPDIRKITCLPMATLLGNRKVCVSHLTNGNSGNRYNQDLGAADKATNWNSSYPTIAGLDRNSTAQEYAWNASYKEIDNTGKGTSKSYETVRGKIDWVYGSFNGNAQNTAASVECALGGMSIVPGRYLSDHCLIKGKFII